LAITYARRYALMSMLGLVADEDDDGNQAASGRQQRSEGTRRPAEFDPGKHLLPQAIAVRKPEDADALRLAQRDFDPDQDWAAIEEALCGALFAARYEDLDGKQKREYYTRLANAVCKLTEGGDFPPPSHDEIRAAYAWAFNGAVIDLAVSETPFEETEEAKE
jgi:hypothetical protein